MGHFKTFMLGMFTAYGVYFITRKGPDGRSILDDLLENPKQYIKQAKEELVGDAARVVKEIIN